MKTNLFNLLLLLIFSILSLQAEDVERTRPAEWEGLVFGGRFMDRFLPLPDKGELSYDVWGQDKVIPRHTANGIEDSTWSYWGGNILLEEDGLYHLFVCRWPENHPKGHMAWPKSEVVHAVSKNCDGPFKVKSVVGEGHNPEIQKLDNRGYFLYASEHFKQTYYYADDIDGPWELRTMDYDSRQRPIDDHMANNTYAKRKDGSMLMVGRGGGIWLSKDGLPPFYQITSQSVYPPYEGKYEDPVVWKTNIQYHLIVNDWLGRIAYYMRSKDGVHWKLDAGEAYLPGIAKHQNGRVEDWYKFERIKVLQDEYGRAYQTNFAVNDTVKRADLGNDNHSSKNICIPMLVGRLIEIVDSEKIDENTQEIQVLIKSEANFNAHKDIKVKSLRFGAPEEVDFGRGCKVIKTEKQGKDLLVTFEGKGNGITDDNFAAKLLGETKKGDLLYGYAKLPWQEDITPLLSAKYPEMTIHGRRTQGDIEIQNFGQVASTVSQVHLEYFDNGRWLTFSKGDLPALNPFEKTTLRLEGKHIAPRNEAVQMRVTLLDGEKVLEVLEGGVVVR